MSAVQCSLENVFIILENANIVPKKREDYWRRMRETYILLEVILGIVSFQSHKTKWMLFLAYMHALCVFWLFWKTNLKIILGLGLHRLLLKFWQLLFILVLIVYFYYFIFTLLLCLLKYNFVINNIVVAIIIIVSSSIIIIIIILALLLAVDYRHCYHRYYYIIIIIVNHHPCICHSYLCYHFYHHY